MLNNFFGSTKGQKNYAWKYEIILNLKFESHNWKYSIVQNYNAQNVSSCSINN